MLRYDAEEIDLRPIVEEHAHGVDVLHRLLPRPQRMIIIAEYPQRNVRFGGLDQDQRIAAARQWIASATGAALTDQQYRMHVDLFIDSVRRRFGL